MANSQIGIESKATALPVNQKTMRRNFLLRKLNKIITLYRSGVVETDKHIDLLILLRKELYVIFEKKLSEQLKYFFKLKRLIALIESGLQPSSPMKTLFQDLRNLSHTLLFPIEIASRLDKSRDILYLYGGNQNFLSNYLQMPFLAQQLDKAFHFLPKEKMEFENKQIALRETSFGNLSSSLPDDAFRNVLAFSDYKGLLKLSVTSKGGMRWHSHFLFHRSCETSFKFAPKEQLSLDLIELGIIDTPLHVKHTLILDNGDIAAVVISSRNDLFVCCLWDGKTGRLNKKSDIFHLPQTIYSVRFIKSGILSFIINNSFQYIWDMDKNELLNEVYPYNRQLMKYATESQLTKDNHLVYVNNIGYEKSSIHLMPNGFKSTLLVTDEAFSDCNVADSQSDQLVFVKKNPENFLVCKYNFYTHREETFCTLVDKPSALFVVSNDAILIVNDKRQLFIHQRNYKQLIWQCGRFEEIDQVEVSPDKNYAAIKTFQENKINNHFHVKLYCIHLSLLKVKTLSLEQQGFADSHSKIGWTHEGELYYFNNFTLTQWKIALPNLVEDKKLKANNHLLSVGKR